MKILLIRPGFQDIYTLFPPIAKKREIRPPDGLLYVASMLEKRGHEARILDNELEGMSADQIADFVRREGFTKVGMGPTTPEFMASCNLALKIKDATGAGIVFGGPHATALPEDVLRENPQIDYVVRGEGEVIMSNLADALSNGGDLSAVKGISYRENGHIRSNPDEPLLENVDDIPLPARHLVPASSYVFPFPNEGLRPTCVMMASRGCPFKCKFCFPMHGKKTRFRDPEKVVEEMEIVIRDYGIRHFIFHDESFGANRGKFMQLCDLIEKRKLNVKWFCFTRADFFDDDFACALKRAGCVKVSIGVESGDEQLLRTMDKGSILAQVEKASKIMDKFGIETRGSFILGLPYESHESIQATIRLAKSIPLKQIGANICTPYPGTELFRMCMEKKGIELLNTDWGNFKRWGNAVIRTPELSCEEIREYQAKMISDFYSRPGIIWYYIKQFIRGNRDLYYFRPLIFGLKEKLNRIKAKFKLSSGSKNSQIP